ncbi:hypothetical protein CesoFtcFv8_007210 [Champsocephalus esox]|uniref:Uncharacterized protein n=1 Tax=Champsocephalus esox TaxID=159716 RepID=A0AAN8H4A3_9TELE|nr:hypothetical protein CesoFtcFv8_007210 [Champsocephalus esox]
MGLPDQLRMLSSLVNVELAHGGSQEPLPSSSRRRQSEEEGRRPVPGMGRTEDCCWKAWHSGASTLPG